MMWRVHAGPIHRLHLQWRVAVEAIVVLYRRLMMRVVSRIIVPAGTVIVKMILVVVLLVVHLQLAHIEWGLNKSKSCIRASVGASVRVRY